MSVKIAKKIGFFAALSMLIGSVVGIGIFFKNGSISKATDGDGVSWLLSWIIGGIISAAAAICFSEIGTIKYKKTGIVGWSEKLVGKKFAKIIQTNYSFFYFGCLVTSLGIFTSEILFTVIGIINKITIYEHAIIGFCIIFLFLFLNKISIRASSFIQQTTVILKFLPLLFAIIIGIALSDTHNDGGQNAFLKNEFTLKGIVIALPGVLFSYDSFLNVTTLTKKVRGGEKRVSFIVIIGMTSIIGLYTLISISSILHNSGSIGKLIQDSLHASTRDVVSRVIFIFILISGFGVINGQSTAMIAVFEQNTIQNTFFGMKILKNKIGIEWTALFYSVLTILLWSFIMGVPSSILMEDYLYDGFSNFPTLFFFIIYTIIIFKYSIKRKKIISKKINDILFYISSWIVVVCITFILGYLFIFHFCYNLFFWVDTSGIPAGGSTWGVFSEDPNRNSNSLPPAEWIESLVMIVCVIIFILTPVVNKLLKKVIS